MLHVGGAWIRFFPPGFFTAASPTVCSLMHICIALTACSSSRKDFARLRGGVVIAVNVCRTWAGERMSHMGMHEWAQERHRSNAVGFCP